MTYTYASRYGPQPINYPGGRSVGTVSIAVRRTEDNVIASLYSDRTRAVALANPVTTSPLGNLTFFADPGEYICTFNGFDWPIAIADNPDELAASIAGKADQSTVNTALAAVTVSLDLKANTADITASLGLKADQTAVNTALALKADTSAVSTSLGLKADQSAVAASLVLKADQAAVTTALGLKADQSAVTASLAAKQDAATAVFRAPNGFVPFGDSISTESGGAGFGNSWPISVAAQSNQKLTYLGNAGVSGNTTAQMLARLATDVLPLGPGVVTVLGGTNDLSSSVSTATWKANIQSIVTQLTAAKITVVLCTIPPRGNTTYLATTLNWNNWLRDYARANSLALVDFWALLADPVTGMYKSGYDSGDALHPHASAHVAMAALVQTQVVSLLRQYAPPRALSNVSDNDNLIANPLLAVGSPTPTSWIPGGTAGMTGVTEALVTDTDFLGKAWEWQFNNPSNAAGFRSFSSFAVSPGASTWAVGDTIAIGMRSKIVTSSGVTPGSSVGLRFQVAFNGATVPSVTVVAGDSVVHPSGLLWFRKVIPSGTTSIQLTAVLGSVPLTGVLTARIGEFMMINFTKLGLT